MAMITDSPKKMVPSTTDHQIAMLEAQIELMKKRIEQIQEGVILLANIVFLVLFFAALFILLTFSK